LPDSNRRRPALGLQGHEAGAAPETTDHRRQRFWHSENVGATRQPRSLGI